jgi:LysM repeat protein
MKRLLILLFNLPLWCIAQNTPLVVEGISPNLYLTHTVLAKENYYSIGRMYNISPKEIAPFNNLQLESGLSLNQVIKIPLQQANFLQQGNAAADEVLVPVLHTVKEKEGLYRISVNYNKVPIETLKRWNNIKTDAAPNGGKLIVGYLKVKAALSPLAAMAKTKPADTGIKEQPAVKKEVPVAVKEPEAVKKEPAVAVKEPVSVKKEIPVTKEKEPVTVPVKKNPPAVVKEAAPAQPVIVDSKTFRGGFFKTVFDQQLKNDAVVAENGVAAVFKSNSGWQDGKYYCLHNAAPPGTIIKVTSTLTGKTIYAKVLDVIPDIKQNNGLLIRISNSAAQELGVGETKFDCMLSYSK